MKVGSRMAGRKIGWKIARTDPALASVRYRIDAPIRLLRARGHDVSTVEGMSIETFDTIVFCKSYGTDDQALAGLAKREGKTVVFDLCDNHFYNPHSLPRYEKARHDLKAMMALADTVTCTTSALADVIRYETGGAVRPCLVEDLPEHSPTSRAQRPDQGVKLLWFGSHGSPNAPSGMEDLLTIREPLETFARQNEVELVVCSNSRDKFTALIEPMALHTAYVEWSLKKQTTLIDKTHAVLIPVTINPFTGCKSNNRLTLALGAGVPTLATGIASYLEFAAFCRLDSWELGLNRLAHSYDVEKSRALHGRDYIIRNWNENRIANQWEQALEISGKPRHRFAVNMTEDTTCQGHLDIGTGPVITGWVRCRAMPGKALTVVVENDGGEIVRDVANLHRPDLESMGMPGANCGFRIEIPHIHLNGRGRGPIRFRVLERDWLIGQIAPAGSETEMSGAITPFANETQSTVQDKGEQARLYDEVKRASRSLDDIRRLLARSVLGVTSANTGAPLEKDQT